MKYSQKHLYAALLVLIGCFFFFRMPFYNQELVGEEGIFAHLFINEVDKPNYLLLSRIDGVNLMAPSQHPAPMYMAINGAGRFTRQFIDFTRLDELSSAFVLRVIFSLPLLLLGISAILYVYRQCNSNLYYWLALFLAFITSPVVLVTSTELQVDASFGIGIFGVWAVTIALVTGSGKGGYRVQAALFFLCNLIAALGKNEWSLILLVSLLLVTLYVVLRGRGIPHFKEQLAVLFFGVAGLAAGNLLSYWYDPLNYVMGFELMSSMSKNESVFNRSKLLQLLGTIRNRWAYVAQNILLVVIPSYLFLRSITKTPLFDRLVAIFLPLAGLYFVSTWTEYLLFNVVSFLLPLAVIVFSFVAASATLKGEADRVPMHPLALLPVLFSALLFGAYFVSTWEVGPRYFTIALAVSLLGVLCVVRHYRDAVQRKLLLNLTLCLLVLNGVAFMNLNGYKRVVTHSNLVQSVAGNDCLPIMSSGEAVFGKGDFLGGACSKEYFQEMSKKYRRPLCGP